MNNSEIKKRIRYFIKIKGMSLQDFMISIGKARNYFSTTGNISSEVLREIGKKYPELNMQWVVLGNGTMLVNEESSVEESYVMEDTIKQRIIRYVKSKKISQRHFEIASGLSNGFVNNIVKTIGADKLHKIALAFPDLNADWLLTGEGSMLKDEPQPVISYTSGVPYYDVDFQLGFDELVPEYRQNPDFLIQMPGYDNATLWCNASGNSMKPEINNGDIVALKKIEDFSFLPFGDVYAIVTTNGMRTIKRLGRSSQEGCYRLIPTNKDEYDEQDIPINMLLHVYRVLGCMKRF